MSQVSITEAAKMAGVSRATIYNDINAGTLSFETGSIDKKMINVAELQRVYKTLKSPDTIDDSKDVEKRQERQSSDSNGAGGQYAVLQERLEAEKKRVEELASSDDEFHNLPEGATVAAEAQSGDEGARLNTLALERAHPAAA